MWHDTSLEEALLEAVWRSALDPANFVARRTTYGGPVPETITRHLRSAYQRHDASTARFAAARTALEGRPSEDAEPTKGNSV